MVFTAFALVLLFFFVVWQISLVGSEKVVTAQIVPTPMPGENGVMLPYFPKNPGPILVDVPVDIMDSVFNPDEIVIPVGTTVVWTHQASLPHTVTSDGGLFDSGTLSNGETFEFTFDTVGSFPYHCIFHGGAGGLGMSGVVNVVDED
jgi:plastocyanin